MCAWTNVAGQRTSLSTATDADATLLFTKVSRSACTVRLSFAVRTYGCQRSLLWNYQNSFRFVVLSQMRVAGASSASGELLLCGFTR